MELPPQCTISGVGELTERLRQALREPGPITLAAGLVVRVDTAALQAVCALVKDARSQGRMVLWEDPSTALLESARLLGLSRHLGLEE